MKTMIMVAPNGARRTKQDHPRLPMTVQELADEALSCANAGASAIHLHVRDDNGAHVLDAERYRQATAAISKRAGDKMIIQITSEAVGIYSASEQMDCVRALKPQAVSMALKEIVPQGEAVEEAAAFFGWLQSEQIAPQFILYGEHDVHRFFELQEQGVIGFSEPFLLFVLGRYVKDRQSDPQDLDPFLYALGRHKAHWAVCAFGRREAECAVYASERGGHVRIGFENNLIMPDGNIAPSNSALVKATRAKLEQSGRAIMDADQARELLNLSLR